MTKKCEPNYETAVDIGSGAASGATITVNPYASTNGVKDRQHGGMASLVGVSVRFIATAGDGATPTLQSTDTVITVTRSADANLTNNEDWDTILDVEDRSGVGDADSVDYDLEFWPPLPWAQDEQLTITLAQDTVTATVLACVSTRWTYDRG